MGKSNTKPETNKDEYQGPQTRSRTAQKEDEDLAFIMQLSELEAEAQENEMQPFQSAGSKRPANGNIDAPPAVKLSKLENTGENEQVPDRVPHVQPPREDPNETRAIVEEQNRAYLESLKKDKEKEKMKEEKEREAKLIKDMKMKAKESLPSEPEVDEEGVIPLAIRLPSGTVLRRRFLAMDSVDVIRQFVFSHDETLVTFEILRGYPAELIPMGDENLGKALKDLGIKGREVLFVREAYEMAD